jgi:6-phosphogluconolactonase
MGGLTAEGRMVAVSSLGITADIASDPAGKFLYLFGPSNDHIFAFSINPNTGELSIVSGSPFSLGGSGSGNLVVDSAGKFLYAPHLSGVAVFAINGSTGALTPVNGSPFSDGATLRAGVLDPTGKFYYASGNTTVATMSVFAVTPSTGALTPISGSPLAAPIVSEPQAVALHPSGNILYASLPVVNDILAWTINRTTGALSLVPGSPFTTGSGVFSIQIDPAGRFLYTCNSNDSTVSGFTVDASTGALMPVMNSPFAVASGTLEIVIDPSGKFLYLSNGLANTITGYDVDAATGELTQSTGAPFPALNPVLLAIVKTH